MDIPIVLKAGKNQAASQIVSQIRNLIIKGDLVPGMRLPAIRTLARQLKLNHLTVLKAYRELESSGYVDLEAGMGTFVSASFPESMSRLGPRIPPPAHSPLSQGLLQTISADVETMRKSLQGVRRAGSRYHFAVTHGDLRLFPRVVWKNLMLKQLRKSETSLLDYQDPRRINRLSEVIRTRILPGRGISAHPEEVMLANGVSNGISLAFLMLVTKGTPVACEEPGPYAFRELIRMFGAAPVPVPIRPDGLDLGDLEKALTRDRPRILMLTPDHQFPTTTSLTAEHRERLMRVVAGHPLWVFEDNFDGEFFYDTPSIPAVKSFDSRGQVLYFSSFSKVLAPFLRIGFIVGPREVIRGLKEFRLRFDYPAAAMREEALADFIEQGHYDYHVRRLRRAYMKRRDALVSVLRARMPDFSFTPPSGGMRLWAEAPGDIDMRALQEKAARKGVLFGIGEKCYLKPPRAGHLHLGFACLDESEIGAGVGILADAVKTLR